MHQNLDTTEINKPMTAQSGRGHRQEPITELSVLD